MMMTTAIVLFLLNRAIVSMGAVWGTVMTKEQVEVSRHEMSKWMAAVTKESKSKYDINFEGTLTHRCYEEIRLWELDGIADPALGQLLNKMGAEQVKAVLKQYKEASTSLATRVRNFPQRSEVDKLMEPIEKELHAEAKDGKVTGRALRQKLSAREPPVNEQLVLACRRFMDIVMEAKLTEQSFSEARRAEGTCLDVISWVRVSATSAGASKEKTLHSPERITLSRILHLSQLSPKPSPTTASTEVDELIQQHDVNAKKLQQAAGSHHSPLTEVFIEGGGPNALYLAFVLYLHGFTVRLAEKHGGKGKRAHVLTLFRRITQRLRTMLGSEHFDALFIKGGDDGGGGGVVAEYFEGGVSDVVTGALEDWMKNALLAIVRRLEALNIPVEKHLTLLWGVEFERVVFPTASDPRFFALLRPTGPTVEVNGVPDVSVGSLFTPEHPCFARHVPPQQDSDGGGIHFKLASQVFVCAGGANDHACRDTHLGQVHQHTEPTAHLVSLLRVVDKADKAELFKNIEVEVPMEVVGYYLEIENKRKSFSSILLEHLGKCGKECEELATRFGPHFLELLVSGLDGGEEVEEFDHDSFATNNDGAYTPYPSDKKEHHVAFIICKQELEHGATRVVHANSRLRLAVDFGTRNTRETEETKSRAVPLLGFFSREVSRVAALYAARGDLATAGRIKRVKAQIDR